MVVRSVEQGHDLCDDIPDRIEIHRFVSTSGGHQMPGQREGEGYGELQQEAGDQGAYDAVLQAAPGIGVDAHQRAFKEVDLYTRHHHRRKAGEGHHQGSDDGTKKAEHEAQHDGGAAIREDRGIVQT